MKKVFLIFAVILMHGMALRAQQCDTVTTLPWFNDFATDFDCWTQGGVGSWTVMYDGEYVEVQINASPGGSALLVSQPVTLGSDTTNLRLYWKEQRGNNIINSEAYNFRVSILVCTAAVFDTTVCDTLYSALASTSSRFVQRSANLASYAGQTVRLAFAVRIPNTANRNMHIADVAVYSDLMPIGSLSGSGFVGVGDTASFAVSLTQGDTTGLAYTWHSTLLDTTFTTSNAQIGLVYPLLGTDTVTVTVSNAYGSGIYHTTVNVIECDTIDSLPWNEPFAWNGSYNLCWVVNGFVHNNPGQWLGITDEDGQRVDFTDYLQCNGGAGSYLVTPAIHVPADAQDVVFMLRCSNISTSPLRVLVSPTAATDTVFFTDTLALLTSSHNARLVKLRLASYAGQTVRIAIIHSNRSALRVLNAGVDYDTLPRIASVTLPARIPTDSATLCTASLRYGSTTGLHYAWHSAAGGTIATNVLGDSAWVTYAFGDMTDTLTVIATNRYGSDTMSRTLRVVDCTPDTALPWSDNFADGLFCWQQPVGSNWVTLSSNVSTTLLNKGPVLCSTINHDSVYDMIVSKPITIAGTLADSIKLLWNAASSAATFPHSYCVMVTTGNPSDSTCSYDTLFRADSLVFCNTSWRTQRVDLSAYLGQTVRVAFYSHPRQFPPSGTYADFYIDDVEIRSTAAPRVAVSGPVGVDSHYPATYTANLSEGTLGGLTYTWHSMLMDTTYTDSSASSSLSSFNLVYTLGGVDTLTVVASNAFGCDTAALVVTVNDCPLVHLPWLENFSGVTAAAWHANGNIPDCWHRHWNGSSNNAPHVVNYPIPYTQNTALVLMAGTGDGWDSVAVVESPCFADPIEGKLLSFYYKYENDAYGTLSVGYLQGDTFVAVTNVAPQSEGLVVLMQLDSFPPDVHRFALQWKRSGSWYSVTIDSIQVLAPESVPTVHIDAPTTVMAFDSALLRAYLTNGDTAGVAYTWHSSMVAAGCAILTATGDTASVVYSAVGSDTIRVVATNAYGSDTAWHTIQVVGSPTGAISGPAVSYTDDTTVYTARLVSGLDSTLAFGWHSTMVAVGSAAMVAAGDTLRIVFDSGGTDTLTLTTTNVVGCSVATRVINVTECHISSFPWTEGFENGMNGCWHLSVDANNSTHWQIFDAYYIAHSGSHFLLSPFVSSAETAADAWFVMQPVDLPDSSNMSLSFYVDFVGNTLTHTYPRLTVLASTTGSDISSFTDTLYTEQSNSPGYVLRSVSLAAYAGQTVWIAFVHGERYVTIHLDDISIDYSPVPIVDISGPSTILSSDTAHFVATLLHGDPTGLTYTWHSDKVDAGTAGAVANGANFDIDYYESGTDFITVIATNAYGSDTATMYCTVTDCEPITQLPYSVSLTSTPGCWIRNGGWVVGDYFSSGISCMTFANTDTDADGWLIMREISVPNDATHRYTLRWHMLCQQSVFQVLVSTDGRNNHSHSNDTLYAVTRGTGSWGTFTASLNAYRGQDIYIAFHNSGRVHDSDMGVVRIDTVQVLVDTISDIVWRTVTVTSADTALGTVTGGGIYHDRSWVTIAAQPMESSVDEPLAQFVSWSDGDSNNPRRVFVVSDTTFTAIFEAEQQHQIEVVANDTERGSVTGGGLYYLGDTVTLTATPYEGYRFVEWSDGDTSNPRTVIVTGDATYTALFEPVVGINGVEDAPYKVYVRQGRVIVEGVENERVQIFDLMGRRHSTNKRLPRGVYLVRIGNAFTKRVVFL